MSDDPSSVEAPVLRVVKGDPTDEETAALVAVVAARRATTVRPPGRSRRSAWGDPALATRPVMRIGPGGWRRSALPL